MRNTAIVMQGPIYFSTESIVNYYNNFDCTLILSTYPNAVHFNTSHLKNFHLITNERLPTPGIGNRNLQRLTSFTGTQLAKNLGAKYTLKCRTDHFFKNPNTINMLELSMASFPLTVKQGNQKERIIIPDGGTTLNKNWGSPHISDHWWFGRTDDILEYTNINNPHWNKDKPYNLDMGTAAEVEFCRLWAHNMGIPIPHAMSELLRDRFIIMDNFSFYYDIVKNNQRVYDIHSDWKVGGPWCDPLTVNSRRWFNFYNGNTYSVDQENALHRAQRY